MTGRRWEVCARAWTTVTVDLEALGYPSHGHDVELEACVASDRRGPVAFDLEELRGAVEELAGSIRYRSIKDFAGGGALEDLLEAACRWLRGRLGVEPSRLSARLPWGSVSLECRAPGDPL